MFKCHDDPTVNESEIIILLDMFECMQERILENEKEKTNLREGRAQRLIVNVRTDLICLYF